MARRIAVPVDRHEEHEAAFLEFAGNAIARRLALSATDPPDVGEARRHGALARARAEGFGGDDLRLGFEAIERAAGELFGPEIVAGWVQSSVEARAGWAPADDFAVSGPFAPPPELVAERRATSRGR